MSDLKPPRNEGGTWARDHGRMHPRAGWALRCTRALGLSVVTLALAVGAHLSAGGLLPGPLTSVVLLVACTVATGGWFGREASRREIVCLLAVGQTLMHGVMTAVAGHAGEPEPEVAGSSGAVAHAVEHLVSDLTPAHAPMALAHLAAAVATGIWLAHGERVLWSLLRLLADATRAAIAALLCVPARLPAVSRPSPVRRLLLPTRLRQRLMSVTHVRRGPPRVRCAC